MSLWKIAWRSIQQRALASGLTAFSIGLGVALVVAVLVIHALIDQSFRRGSQGYDLIVGAKGGQIPLVLNSVFYLGNPIENIPYDLYEEFATGRYRGAVKTVVPICMGHAYQGVPVIATEPDMFTDLKYLDDREYEFAQGRNFEYAGAFEAVAGWAAAREAGLRLGDQFRPVGAAPSADAASHEDLPFTIVGILAPTGTPNDRALFVNMEGFFLCPSHAAGPSSEKQILQEREDREGSAKEQEQAAEHEQHAPDGEAHVDHVPGQEREHAHDGEDGHEHAAAEGDDHAHDAHDAHDDHDDHDAHDDHAHDDHDHDSHAHDSHAHDDHDHDNHAHDGHDHDHADSGGHAHDHEHHREVTALLVVTRMDDRPGLATSLYEVINESEAAQAVRPAEVIDGLFEGIIGNIQIVLLILAVLVVVVAGIGILVSIYNSMSDRRHEIAVMRALGARRRTVMSIILVESILLALGGGLFGMLLGHGLIGALSPLIADKTMVVVRPWEFQWVELVLIPGLVSLATIVGYLPAVAAYKTDVARSLTATG